MRAKPVSEERREMGQGRTGARQLWPAAPVTCGTTWGNGSQEALEEGEDRITTARQSCSNEGAHDAKK